jgi:hypothetical protein
LVPRDVRAPSERDECLLHRVVGIEAIAADALAEPVNTVVIRPYQQSERLVVSARRSRGDVPVGARSHIGALGGQVDLPVSAYAAQVPTTAVISKYTPMVPKTAARTATGNGARKLHVKSDAPPKTRARRSLGPTFFFMLTFLQRDKARRQKKDSKKICSHLERRSRGVSRLARRIRTGANARRTAGGRQNGVLTNG